MSTLTLFDKLLDHLNAREDPLAQEVRRNLEFDDDQLDWLDALEAAGVDNWPGCDDARDIYNEMRGEEGED